MILAGYVLSTTVEAVALNRASRLLMPARASWGSCFVAAILSSALLTAVIFGALRDPQASALVRPAALFFVVVCVCSLWAKALLREEDGRERPSWPAAFGIAALAQSALALVQAAFGALSEAEA